MVLPAHSALGLPSYSSGLDGGKGRLNPANWPQSAPSRTCFRDNSGHSCSGLQRGQVEGCFCLKRTRRLSWRHSPSGKLRCCHREPCASRSSRCSPVSVPVSQQLLGWVDLGEPTLMHTCLGVHSSPAGSGAAASTVVADRGWHMGQDVGSLESAESRVTLQLCCEVAQL